MSVSGHMGDGLWTAADVARFLNTEPTTVYEWVRTKGLPCTKLSARCFRFDPVAVKAWVAAKANGAEQ